MLKLDELFRNQENFIIYLFFILQIWVLRVKIFPVVFGQYFSPWIRIRGSAYFADPEPGSQNLAEPMDPDPKH